jgi:hypothetical protein
MAKAGVSIKPPDGALVDLELRSPQDAPALKSPIRTGA